MRTTHWYSASKKAWSQVGDLPGGHLHNALKKLERGDYEPGDGVPLTEDERFMLAQAIRTEIELREQAATGEAPPE